MLGSDQIFIDDAINFRGNSQHEILLEGEFDLLYHLLFILEIDVFCWGSREISECITGKAQVYVRPASIHFCVGLLKQHHTDISVDRLSVQRLLSG